MGKNDQPATKKEMDTALGRLEKRLDKKMDKMDGRMDKMDGKIDRLDGKIDKVESRLESKMEEMKDEILHHFDVVAENIHQDMAGANKDEVSLLKNVSHEHNKRITRVEQKVGLR